MDRNSIRAWRRIQEKRVWRNRIKRYANYYYEMYNPATGRHEYVCDWKAMRSERWVYKLKDTATICSCWMCCNYLYNRREYRRETARLLREQSED